MKEKFFNTVKCTTIAISLLFLVISCKEKEKQKKEPLEWGLCMNAPYLYEATRPMVTACYKGKITGGVSINVIGNGSHGWGGIDVGETIVDSRHLPDSLFVEWSDAYDGTRYNKGINLPVKILNKLIHTKYKSWRGMEKFNNINVGMAPGGNICIFVNHLELLRTKAISIGKDTMYKPNVSYRSLELDEYLKHHPMDFSVWEKPDSRYELSFGFCSEDSLIKYLGADFTSKEGMRNWITKESIDYTKWNIPFGKKSNNFYHTYQQLKEINLDNKAQLPIQISLAWLNDNVEYDTNIVLQKDFPKRFTKEYINPKTGKKSNYNRIVFGVERDGEHCILWLDGPGKQEKIMRFKATPTLKDDKGQYINQVSYTKEYQYY